MTKTAGEVSKDSMVTCAVLLFCVAALTACGDDAGTSGSTGSASELTTSETPTSSGSAADSGSSTSGGSGSESASDGTGPSDDPLTHEPVCSREQFWTMGNEESPNMHPGVACLTCHDAMEPEIADRFPIAGTVYPTGHEPDDCLGLDGSAVPIFVEITMADARVVKLAVNGSGNFMYDIFKDGGSVMFPITARVVQGDQERKMLSPQATGDCNSCHAQTGTLGAPGRIVAPIL